MIRVNSWLSLWAIVLWFSTTDSIAQWQQLDVNNAGNLLDVAYATPEKAWACGQSGVYGLMIRSIDGGKSWIGERHGAPISRINRLQMIDTLTGFAVGDRGLILKRGWVPGTVGIQWHVLPELSQDNLSAVSFVDANVGWIAAGRGRVWKTSDGGSSWSEQQQENQEFSVIYDMYFLDTLNGWTAGFHPSKTTDGGLSWSRMTLPLEQEWRGVHFVNRNVGFLVGTTGGLLRTTNGGSSWTRIWSTTGVMLMSVDFVNEQEGYIVGGGINDGAWIDSSRVLRTTDAGLTWAQEPHPTDVWLNQIDVYDEDHVLAVGGKSIMIQRAKIVSVADHEHPDGEGCQHESNRHFDLVGRELIGVIRGPAITVCQRCSRISLVYVIE